MRLSPRTVLTRTRGGLSGTRADAAAARGSVPGRPGAAARCAGLLLALAPLLGACSTYPQRVAGAMSSFQTGDFAAAAEQFQDESRTDSAFLSGAEAGTAYLAAGAWEQAIAAFTAAAGEAEEVEERALLGADALGDSLVSIAIGERWADYVGEGYERVQVHVGLALAYLASGKLDDVFVEARLANQLLEAEEDLYDTDYGAGGLGHYVSALTYELLDRPADAYIDYKRMHDKGVAPSLVGPSLVRLARRLNRDDELPRWLQLYGEPAAISPDHATIVALSGADLAPFKVEITIPIPTGDGILQWSVPSYQSRGGTPARFVLDLPDDSLAVRASVVEDVDRVARENLDDRIAWLATKSAVRAFAKRELTRELERQHGATGALIGNLFAIITERADLRSWHTLPAQWQAARAYVPPGEHTVVVSRPGGQAVSLGRFELEPGETMFVLARTLGPQVHAHAIGGRRVDLAPAPADDPPADPVRPVP